jgi:hypothetical protein
MAAPSAVDVELESPRPPPPDDPGVSEEQESDEMLRRLRAI